MLKISGLDAYYGDSKIIDNLTLDVPKGKIVALIGRNGVGKSTTLKSVMGLTKTPRGSVKLDGTEMLKLKPYERAKLGIGYVPQGRDIFPQMTVEENLHLGLTIKGKKAKVPDNVISLFPVISKFALRKGGDLSGGQQQQLAIARALASEPKLLILDEPTEGIQPSVIEDIGYAIKKINEWTGISILIVEQYLDFVLDVADEYYVMDKGQVVMHGDVAYANKEEIQTRMTI
ncbi:MAG: urea ABC transporter ATP-binding subunit UrtE [Clostridia bacterium]|nr:urea ABC transporter ATP-binding subunit UrtE [Clostridia bacterium]